MALDAKKGPKFQRMARVLPDNPRSFNLIKEEEAKEQQEKEKEQAVSFKILDFIFEMKTECFMNRYNRHVFFSKKRYVTVKTRIRRDAKEMLRKREKSVTRRPLNRPRNAKRKRNRARS